MRGHIVVERNSFRQVTHAFANFKRFLQDIVSSDCRCSIGRRHIAGEDPHGSCLACPVWSEKADDLSLFGIEGQVFNGAARAIIFSESFDLDHWYSLNVGDKVLTNKRHACRWAAVPFLLISRLLYRNSKSKSSNL